MVNESKGRTTRILIMVLLNVLLLSTLAFGANLSSMSAQSQVENSIVHQLQILIITSKNQYFIGEDIEINVSITNHGDITISDNLTTIVTNFQEYGIMEGILHDIQPINVSPHSYITRKYVLNKDLYKNNGYYEVFLYLDDGTSNSTYFNITGGLNLTLFAPEIADVNETFTVTLGTENILDAPITNIKVKADLPYYADVSGPLNFTIPILAPGAINTTTWLVSMPVSGGHSIGFRAISEDGDLDRLITSIEVLSPPRLSVKDVPSYSVKNGDLFEVSAKVKNIGDYPLKGVEATLSLPANISTTEPLTKDIGDLSGGESSTINWTVTADELGSYGFDVFAEYETVKDSFHTEGECPKPLVITREYSKGKVIWINSGDKKDFIAKSISLPEKEFITLLKNAIEWISTMH